MRVERARENVFTVTATGQELSALVAAARMSLDVMRASPDQPPAEAMALLERVLQDFDDARARLARPDASAPWPRRAGVSVECSGRGADRHLLAHVRGHAIELLGELVVVELERVEVRAPAHRVLRDQRRLHDLV